MNSVLGRPPNAGICQGTQYAGGATQTPFTHHEVGVWQTLAVSSDKPNATVRRNFLYIISKDEVDAFGSNLLLNGSTELVWVCRVQKLIIAVNNSDFLVLCNAAY